MGRVSKIIAEEIAKRGIIPFFRFMELALYCPECGYYEVESDKIGRHGDFYTSVSVGSLFGQLLAFQFEQWWQAAPPGRRSSLELIEAGAYRADLARDILTWFRDRRPESLRQIRYTIIEPSERRRSWQVEQLAEFRSQVRWASDFEELGLSTRPGPESTNGSYTIIFSNELLDAMPLERFGWDARRKEWFEWGIVVEKDELAWRRNFHEIQKRLPPGLRHVPPELAAVLPDGFTVEHSPAALDWWRKAATFLRFGKLLTFDYGTVPGELIRPERPEGTLRAFAGHHPVANVLANPGEQDLTADVNFAALQQTGELTGLRTESFCLQAQFLTQIAQCACQGSSRFGHWDRKQTRQFQTLTHPEHLGGSFRVLIQGREGSDERDEPTPCELTVN